MVKTPVQIAVRIYIRIQHRATGATHRSVNCLIASAIADAVKCRIVDGMPCGVDDIATGATDDRMPVRMLFSVVSSIAHGTTEGMREGESGHFRYQIEDWCFWQDKCLGQTYSGQYTHAGAIQDVTVR